MMRAGHEARILSIVLLTLADDEGRGRWIEPVMAAEAFGYDSDPLASLSRGLASLSGWYVQVYEVSGEGYFQVIKWAKHQKIDRPTESKLPPPPAGQLTEIIATRASSREAREEVARPREELASGSRISDVGSRISEVGGISPPVAIPDEWPGPLPRPSDDSFDRRSCKYLMAFATAFRATGATASPWMNGIGTRECHELARWLESEFKDTALETAGALGSGFARSSYAKRQGYRFRGSGGLIDGPGEFLKSGMTGYVRPSEVVHDTTSDEDFRLALKGTAVR